MATQRDDSGLDELLTPALDAADDAVDLGRPWRPWSLVVLTVFGGLLAGGPLAAWNFRWLGQPRWFVPVLLGCLLASLAIQVASFELYGRDQLAAQRARNARTVAIERDGSPATPAGGAAGGSSAAPSYREQRQIWRPILRVLDVLPVVAIAALQRRRFRVFEGTGQDPRSLWWPGLAAIGVAIGVAAGLLPLLHAFLGSR